MLHSKYRKINMDTLRDKMASMRNCMLACQKEDDPKACKEMLIAFGRDLRDMGQELLHDLGEREDEGESENEHRTV